MSFAAGPVLNNKSTIDIFSKNSPNSWIYFTELKLKYLILIFLLIKESELFKYIFEVNGEI